MAISDSYKVSGFYQQIKKTDLARGHLFRVTFPSRLGDEAELYVFSTKWPTKAIGTIATPFLGFKFKMPGTASFESWSVQLRCDMRYDLRKFVSDWMSEIYDINTGASETFSRLETVTLTLLDNKLNPTKKIKFEGMYPTGLGEVTLSQESGENVATMDVTFEYQYWDFVV